MNAIGPIEAEMRANHAAVRARLFAPAPKRILSLEEILDRYRKTDVTYKVRHSNLSRTLQQENLRMATTPARKIIVDVANKHNVPFKTMMGKCRIKQYVIARHEAIYRIYTELEEMSLPRIARIMGGRDHTTILNAINRHQERMKAGLV